MSTAVRELVNSFDALPAFEQHQAALEILRRSTCPLDDLTSETLVEVADDLVRNLDADEAANALS